MGQAQQEQAPGQQPDQGGGPGGDAVVVGGGHSALGVPRVAGQPYQRREENRCEIQDLTIHHQQFSRPGGDGEQDLAQIEGPFGLHGGGGIELPAVQGQGQGQAGDLKNQVLLPVFRQGGGEAVKLAFLQSGGLRQRVEEGFAAVRRHHAGAGPVQIAKVLPRLGKGVEIEQGGHARSQEQQNEHHLFEPFQWHPLL